MDTSIHFSPPEKLKIEDLQNAFLQVFEIYQQENITYPSQKVKILVNLKERIQQILQKLTKGKKYNFNDLLSTILMFGTYDIVTVAKSGCPVIGHKLVNSGQLNFTK